MQLTCTSGHLCAVYFNLIHIHVFQMRRLKFSKWPHGKNTFWLSLTPRFRSSIDGVGAVIWFGFHGDAALLLILGLLDKTTSMWLPGASTAYKENSPQFEADWYNNCSPNRNHTAKSDVVSGNHVITVYPCHGQLVYFIGSYGLCIFHGKMTKPNGPMALLQRFTITPTSFNLWSRPSRH